MNLQARLLWLVLPFLAFAVLLLALGMSYFSRETVLEQARQDGQVPLATGAHYRTPADIDQS